MKTTSKQKQTASSLATEPPLTEDYIIASEKFVLMSTERAVRESQKFSSQLDKLIEELKIQQAQTEEENQQYEYILQRNFQEINRLKEKGKSQEALCMTLQPKMNLVEKNTNWIVTKRDEIETSSLLLEQKQNELKFEERRYDDLKNEEERLNYQQTLLKTQIFDREKEVNRMYKILNQCESQNEELFNLKKKLNNDLQQFKGNIRVYCRVRPSKKENSIISVTSENTLKIRLERETNRQGTEKYEQGHVFEQIFEENDRQHVVFTELSQLVQSSVDGKNVCIFAYGQTGSGKTYTLLGPEEEGRTMQELYEERGIASRSIELIFQRIEYMKKFKMDFKVFLSIQEIYLEKEFDLIKKAETVKDKCTEVFVTEVEEVLAFMKEASFNRKQACTNMNERSSRSHLIITLRLEGQNLKTNQMRRGSLVFVDLAGSERLKTSKVEGQMLKQTQFINKSLSALGVVINELKNDTKHVSFRNSKLTRVLQNYLEGESKTLMFVNVSPDYQDSDQTKISLAFAESVREVKMKKQNK